MVLGLGLSGVGFTGPDTGGFAGEADGELFTRWVQMTTFMPFFRAHTAAQTPDQEPWSYGEPYLSIVRRFIQLRYELLPYLYTATWQMAERGWPMVRPVWWYDASQGWDLVEEVDDAFLCGDALLVVPVGEPEATSRDVKLPSGAWYDFWTNRVHQGPTTFEQAAPLETVPLFVREGTVLPMGEFAPTVEQRLQKFLRLSVYPLAQDGARTSWLYDDAGEGFAYREGEYRVSRFIMRCTEDQMEITWAQKGAYSPPYEHIELTLNGLKRAPREVLADGTPFPIIKADPIRHTVLLGVPLFETLTVTL
jgi:alpha-glucosidase